MRHLLHLPAIATFSSTAQTHAPSLRCRATTFPLLPLYVTIYGFGWVSGLGRDICCGTINLEWSFFDLQKGHFRIVLEHFISKWSFYKVIFTFRNKNKCSEVILEWSFRKLIFLPFKIVILEGNFYLLVGLFFVTHKMGGARYKLRDAEFKCPDRVNHMTNMTNNPTQSNIRFGRPCWIDLSFKIMVWIHSNLEVNLCY